MLSELPEVLALPRPARVFDIAVTPPGSKSLTNRAMLLAGLANGESVLRNALIAGEDAEVMRAGLVALGASIEEREGEVRVRGVGGRWPAAGVTLTLGNSGTSVRFLSAAAMLAEGPVTIDGTARMRERPIGELGELLTRLGAGVEYLDAAGFPPVRVTPPAGGAGVSTLEVASFQSSQFISALLLIGAWLPKGLTLRLTGPVTSAAYIQMTLGLLARVGASVRVSEDLHVIRIGGGGLPGFEYMVEPDATGATYFWAGAAMVPGARCAVRGLDSGSLQGDSLFPEVLGRMGARVQRGPGVIEVAGVRQLQPILADMSDMPDAAMTLASVACFANGTSILRGLKTLHIKECDRIAAVRTELTKLGVSVQTPVQGDADAMTITPPAGGIDCSPTAAAVEFETYDDHRMAMSLALIGLRRPNVRVRGPKCVGKTYPGFWGDFAKFYT
ncbi:MAG TPA: 3-phosphoshikimate 1-carboxyvinyltransferase [Phycisphaerales bacterium]|nr:3-phosphoshikimate 1-carboxyvinyltransferase [Phycisphaerales bacterium]